MNQRFVGGFAVAVVVGVVLAVAISPMPAAAQEGVAIATPAVVAVNQPTDITVTIQITDSRLIAGSVFLQQVDATGKAIANLGTLNDAGTNGDAVAGDKIYSIRQTFSQPTRLRVSWALLGVARRPVSNVVDVKPQPQIRSLTPSVVTTGNTYSIAISADFTNFVGGATVASFGTGTSVGGADDAAFGPVTVTSPTTATAQVAVSATAAAGFRRVTIRTGTEEATLDATFQVQVLNRPPIAAPGGPYSGNAGVAIAFDGSGSSDPDGDPLTFSWDFGDGSNPVSGLQPTHAYAAPGTFTVSLTVKDGRGGSNTATSIATVIDRTPPVISLVAPREVVPGTSVTVSARATDNVAVESVTFDVNGANPSQVKTPPYERVIDVPALASIGATMRVNVTARDTSGNTASTQAMLTIVAAPDTENPSITLNAPPRAAPGTSLHVSATATDNVGVAAVVFFVNGVPIGRATTPSYEATYKIPADTPIGALLLVTATATDFSQNTADAQATVAITAAADTTPPTVKLTAPTEVTAGGTLHLSATAEDNVGVASVAFSVGGVVVATLTKAPFQVDFALPPSTAVGDVLSVEARARDFSLLEASDVASTRVVASPVAGRGVIAGVVYDDTTGLPIAGATARLTSLNGSAPATPVQAITDARGRFRLPSSTGTATIRVFSAGVTESYRVVTVVDGQRTDPFDARLTPLDPRDNRIPSVTGGTASSQTGDVSLGVPAGALTSDQTFRLTPVRAQGLIARLPLGWSPIAAVDIAPAGMAFGASATVSLRAPSGVPAGVSQMLARWDATAGVWIMEGNASGSPDNTMLTASVSETGQYVVLLPDAAPHAPPAAVVGQGVPAVLANPPPATVSAFITPSPKILFAQPGARSQVGVLAVPATSMPSGSTFRLDLVETFNFVSGTHLFPDPSGQDLVLYSFGAGGPLTLISEFTVSPSRAFPLTMFQGGIIDLAISMPLDRGAARGTVIGAAGGTATVTNGGQLVVPSGAAVEDLPVVLSSLTQTQLSASIPTGLTFIAGIQVDLHGGMLARPATLSIPVPTGLSPTSQVLVVQLREVDGVSYLVLVGVGTVQGNRLVVLADPTGDGSLAFPGVQGEGRYALLRADVPVGFITGIVSDASSQPMSGGLIVVDTLNVVAVAGAGGRYVLAAPLGDARVTATNRATGDVVTLVAHVTTPGVGSPLALTVAPTPPTVMAINPTDGARNVTFTTPVTITFSRALDPASVSAGAVTLTKAGAPVSGTVSVSPSGTAVTFRPDALLESAGTYQVTVAATLRDLAGHTLGSPFVAQFTTVNVTPPPPPAAGAVTATIPDATGRSTVAGTQGTAVPGGTVQIKNLATGAITTLMPNADGSFSGQVSASPADKLELTVFDVDGNKTSVPVPPFRSADGRVVVGVEGGRVEGPGGVAVDIPAGALPDGTVVSVRPVAELDLALPVPQGFSFTQAVRLDLGGVTPRTALDLAVPAPASATLSTQVLVARVVQLPNRLAWILVDRAHLVNGKFQTASPPFPGALQQDTYVFVTSTFPCISYVTKTYKFGFQTLWIPVTVEGFVLPFEFLTAGSETKATIAAFCDSQVNIHIQNPNTGQVIAQISQHVPATQDEIFFAPGVQTDDQAPPTIVWTNANTGFELDQIKILFSKPMDVDSVCSGFVLKDHQGHAVTGTIAGCLAGELEQGNTLMRFVPSVPLLLNEQYQYSLTGAADTAGNALQVSPSDLAFTTFAPQSVFSLGLRPETLQNFLKCAINTSSCTTSVYDAAAIGDTLFVANGARTNDVLYADPQKKLLAFDATDPGNPVLIGFHPTETNPRALAVVANASFVLPNGLPFVGDILLVAGGGAVIGGQLSAKLEVYDVTACTRHIAVANCLDGALKGHKLLSTPTGLPPQPGVPPTDGVPLQIAALASRDSTGVATEAVAYVVVSPVGLEAVDVRKAFNFPITGNTSLGPDGTVLGDFLDVTVVKNVVVAVGTPGQFATAEGYSLLAYSPQLSLMLNITQALGLPGAIARVAAGQNLVFDIDQDGNVGQAEEDDGDAVRAAQELFDVVVVSSGPLTDGCATAVVPCGRLYVIDVSSLTDLASFHHDLRTISRIPLPGPAFSVQVDADQKVAYVEVRGSGLMVVDLSHLFDVLKLVDPKPPIAGLLDVNGDGRDDRVLGMIPLSDIMMTKVRVDTQRGLAFVNGVSSGLNEICVHDGCNAIGIEITSALLGKAVSSGALEVLITPEQWSTSTQICFDINVRAKPNQVITYAATEFPRIPGNVMLDLSNGQDTGTVNQSTSKICFATKPSSRPLESYVQIKFLYQGALVKRALIHLIPAMITAGDAKFRTTVDRINHDVCTSDAGLGFDLSYAANLTIKVDGSVITVNDVAQQDVPYGPGRYRLPIAFSQGEHSFEIVGVFKRNPDVKTTATGRIVHEVVIDAALPVGHTMIKGVDIVDGHLTHSTQDVVIPGRGLSLDFTRTYSSAGSASGGPLGAGWTHSYNIRLVHDSSCDRFVVIGGEGSGNAFKQIGGILRPQIGYHSTLTKTSQTQFDFFTKARVQYHFEREPALIGEIYTLRFIQEPNGNRITLDYLSGDGDATTLDAVRDSSGRSLVFEYQDSVTAPDGSVVFFGEKKIKSLKGLSPGGASTPDLVGLMVAYEYDTFGNLVRVTRKSPDPGANLNDERVERYTYSDADPQDRHNLLSYTDPNGHATNFAYFSPSDTISGLAGFVQASLPGLSAAFGLQTPQEVSAFFGAWQKELVKAVQQPEGVVTNFFYDFPNKTRSVTDPRAPDEPIAPTIYTLNEYGVSVKVTEPLGKITAMAWCTDTPSAACPDRNGDPGVDVLMISKTDAEGQTRLYEYGDRLGNLTKETVQFSGSKAPVTLKDGVTTVGAVSTVRTYEPTFSKMTSMTDAEGNTTVFLIDADYPDKPSFCPAGTGSTGNLLGVRDAEGNTTCYAYASNGDRQTVTDPRSLTTSYQYDAYGNRTRAQDPLGNVVTSTFDERSRLIETRDTVTHHIQYAYDGLDRKVVELRLDDLGTQGTSQSTVYRYTPNGEMETMTDGLGQVTRYVYDTLNRNTNKVEQGVVQVDGTVVDLTWGYAYDRGSNLRAEIDPRGITHSHTYDALNRRTKTEVQGPVTPNEIIAASTYDLVGNNLTATDLHGHQTTFTYDGLYRIVRASLPFPNAAIVAAYDRSGHKVRETDASGHPMTYVYDHVYRVTQQTDAAGNTVTFQYDAASNKTREENLSSRLVVEYLDYDGLNRPKAMRQTGPGLGPAGYTTLFNYQDTSNALVVTNPRGFKTRTRKDGLDRVVQTIVDTDGLQLTTSFTYDGNGNLKTVQDPQGGDIDVTYDYDGLNRKIRATYVSVPSDEEPVTEEFVYDGDNNVVRYKDKRGTVLTNTYDNLNRLLAKTVVETITNGGAELRVTAYAYDDANTSVTETDANGNVAITYSDGLHRPRIIDDPDPNAAYDPLGTGPFPKGLVVHEYDAVNKRATIDKLGRRTEYDYDAINRITETREFDLGGTLQTKLRVEYLDAQNQKRETDRRGIVTVSQLDALGRRIQLRRAGLDMATQYGSAEVVLGTFEFDGVGNKVTFVDGRGNRTEEVYDAANRQIAFSEGVGSPVAATTTTTYDSVGNVLTVKDGRNHGGAFDMKYDYDARHRKVAATNGEGETTTYAYDANNNLTGVTEPRGPASTTRYSYDELNKLLAVDETPRMGGTTASGVTRFFYDGNRNKIAQQDANGNLVTYKYDGLNRLTDTLQHTVAGSLTSATTRGPTPTGNPAGGNDSTALHWNYGYDLKGNQTLVLDAKGQRVDKAYDYLDRLTTKSYSQHTEPGLDFQMRSIAYTYDGNGNVVSITEVKQLGGSTLPPEVTLQTFDALERLRTRIHRDYDDSDGKRTEYGYDIQGNRTTIVDPDGLTTSYAYDARNRLTAVATQSGTTTYSYWEDGLIKSIEYPNGSVSDRSDPRTYDRADRIKRIVNRPAGERDPPFSSYVYTYDANGNRLSQVEVQRDLSGGEAETTTYAYDNLNRLLSVTYGPENNPAGRLSYTYAANGNRLTEQGTDPRTGEPIDRSFVYAEVPGKADVTFNGVNALSQIRDNLDPTRTVTYEYDRDLNQTAKEKAGARTTFQFGIRDEMLAVGQTASSLSFDYDYSGMRVKKSGGPGGETRYLYDAGALFVEYGGAAAALSTLRKYDYGYGLLSLTSVDPAGGRSSQFYLADGLMSTANLTDQTGSLLQSYRYDAWGGLRAQRGTSTNPLQYTGHYTDAETGLHYFGARYYDDETGRFLSQDAYLGESHTPPSLHRYLYAYANPLRFVDLAGYQTIEANPGSPIEIQAPGVDGTAASGKTAPATVRTYSVEQWSNGENDRLAEQGKKVLGEISEAWAKQIDAIRKQIAERERRMRGRQRALEEAQNMKLIDQSENAPTGAPAGDIVRWWKRQLGEYEQAMDKWTEQDPSLWKNIAASIALAPSQFADEFTKFIPIQQLLTLGEGGVKENVGRVVDIALFAVPEISKARAALEGMSEARSALRTASRTRGAEFAFAEGRAAPTLRERYEALFATPTSKVLRPNELVVFADKDPHARIAARAFAKTRGADFADVDDIIAGRVVSPSQAGRVLDPSQVDVVHVFQHGPVWKTYPPLGLAVIFEEAGLAPKGYVLQSCKAFCGSAVEFRNLVNTPILASTDIVSFEFGNNPWPFTRLIVGRERTLQAGKGWELIPRLVK